LRDIPGVLRNRRRTLILTRHILSASVIRLDHCQALWAWMGRRIGSLTLWERGSSWQGSGGCLAALSPISLTWMSASEALHGWGSCRPPIGALESQQANAFRGVIFNLSSCGPCRSQDRTARHFGYICMRDKRLKNRKKRSFAAVLIDLSCVLRILH